MNALVMLMHEGGKKMEERRGLWSRRRLTSTTGFITKLPNPEGGGSPLIGKGDATLHSERVLRITVPVGAITSRT